MASAELFKVTCVTCQASLSVRNAALIGQIVACPKCDSMVQITRPSAQALVAPVVVATAPAIAESAFEEPVGQLGEQVAVPERELPVIGSVLETTAASNANFIVWAVASFVIGATLTGAFLVLRAGDGNEPISAGPISSPIQATESSPVVTQTPKPTVEVPRPAQHAEEKLGPVVTAVAAEQKTEPLEAEPTLLGAIEVPVEEKTTAPPLPPQVPEPKLVIDAPEQPRVARKFDPLALDPEQLDVNAMTEAAAVEEPATAEENTSDEEATHVEVPPVNLPVRLNENSDGLTGARSANVQLRQVLPAVTVNDMPLLDFLSLISQLAGVPVSVAPQQLQMAGISPGRPVSLDLTSASLTNSLDDVLNPLHLEVTIDGPQIVVIRQEADKVRSVDYPIDDLLSDRLTAADFAKWIEQLIAPESWESNGGEGKIAVSDKSLRIEQSQAAQYQVLFFLERIRLAKELPLRSKYPERLLSAKPLAVGVADRLAAPTTFTFSHDTPLAEVIQHWQGEAGIPIFVDWPALAAKDIWPDSLITCAIANESWYKALDKILAPIGLGWRPAYGGAIQITSRARIETEPQLEIYPLGQWNGDSTGATAIHDPVNKLTYVRASAAALRH